MPLTTPRPLEALSLRTRDGTVLAAVVAQAQRRLRPWCGLAFSVESMDALCPMLPHAVASDAATGDDQASARWMMIFCTSLVPS